MKSILVLVVYSFIYVISLFLLWWKLLHVYRNPNKYDQLKNPDLFYFSKWHDKKYKHYGRHYWAGMFTFLPIWLFVTITGFWGLLYVQKLIFFPHKAVWFFYCDGIYYSLLPYIFTSFFIAYLVCYLIEIPIFTAATMQAFNSKRRSNDWKKLLIALIVLITLGLPFQFLGFNNYGYWTGSEIVYNYFLSITERRYSYDDILYAQPAMKLTAEDRDYYFEYVLYFKDGKSVDLMPKDEFILYFNNDIEKLLNLHESLEKHNILVKRQDITRKEFEMVKGKADLEFAKQMFQVKP